MSKIEHDTERIGADGLRHEVVLKRLSLVAWMGTTRIEVAQGKLVSIGETDSESASIEHWRDVAAGAEHLVLFYDQICRTLGIDSEVPF